MGMWTHACPFCGAHCDWVCPRCLRCEDCCTCKGQPTLLSRMARDAQPLIRRAVTAAETDRNTKNPA